MAVIAFINNVVGWSVVNSTLGALKKMFYDSKMCNPVLLSATSGPVPARPGGVPMAADAALRR